MERVFLECAFDSYFVNKKIRLFHKKRMQCLRTTEYAYTWNANEVPWTAAIKNMPGIKSRISKRVERPHREPGVHLVKQRDLYGGLRLLALLIQDRKGPKGNGENRPPGLK
ncbi:uncharacterized protein LOC117220580 [Megalopta genalis]|uniref:uncharacterized protein LOC117220580 n=1 Tax=Megalopta genalis TaxID=115081 RepID=UPI003FD428FC